MTSTRCGITDGRCRPRTGFATIVSSAAALSSKRMVSAEAFTCMYGFPATYLRQEQTADLKMVLRGGDQAPGLGAGVLLRSSLGSSSKICS